LSEQVFFLFPQEKQSVGPRDRSPTAMSWERATRVIMNPFLYLAGAPSIWIGEGVDPLCQRRSGLGSGYVMVGAELKHARIFPLGFAPKQRCFSAWGKMWLLCHNEV